MPLKASLDIQVSNFFGPILEQSLITIFQVATGSLLRNPTVHKIQDVLMRAAGVDELPESNAEQDETPSSSSSEFLNDLIRPSIL